MRGIPDPVLALLDKAEIKFHAAWRIVVDDTDSPAEIYRVWSGHWELEIGGETYLPLGATNLAIGGSFEEGQVANGIDAAITSQDPLLIPTLLEMDLRGRPLKILTLFFDVAGTTLLHYEPELFGTMDEVPFQDTPGGDAVVIFKAESEAQGIKRQGGRIASDQDQRQVDPDDGSFRFKSRAGDMVLYWGGEQPKRAAVALNQ